MNSDNEYYDLEVIHPMWFLTAVFVAQRGKALGAPRPADHRGGLGCNFFVLADGAVRWRLVYADPETGKQTQIAKWLTRWMPESRICKPHVPVKPSKEPIHITSGGGDWYANVVVDGLGLPWPVPVGATL